MSDEKEQVNFQHLIEELLRSAQEWQRLLEESHDAGFDVGRSVGVVDAYNILEKAGYVRAAKLVKQLVDDQVYFMKSRGDA